MSDLVQRLRDPESLLAELMARLGTDDPLFDAFREAMPDKYWARYDLSAARLGYEFARFAMLAAAPQQPAAQPVAINIHAAFDALERMVEAHIHRAHPFHDPIARDAELALRELRAALARAVGAKDE